MAEARKTMLEWFVYLDSDSRAFTLAEFTALMLLHIRQHLGQLNERTESVKQASEHVEGMLGSLDETLAQRDPLYRQYALRRPAAVPRMPELDEARRG